MLDSPQSRRHTVTLMAFVKLDTGILDSTLWTDPADSRIFVTALLMAMPREIETPMEQLSVRSLERTGFLVPPGWYGFIGAAGVGIVRRAHISDDEGLPALERLGDEDPASRSSAFGGRRLVRVDGGYIVLNFMNYRDKDHTARQRSQRYRDRKASLRDDTLQDCDVTQSDNRGQRSEALSTAPSDEQNLSSLESSTTTARAKPEDFSAAWSKATAGLQDFQRVAELTAKRKRQCEALQDAGITIQRFALACSCIQDSAFLLGANDRGQRCTFDWLISDPTNVIKVCDGTYADSSLRRGRDVSALDRPRSPGVHKP